MHNYQPIPNLTYTHRLEIRHRNHMNIYYADYLHEKWPIQYKRRCCVLVIFLSAIPRADSCHIVTINNAISWPHRLHSFANIITPWLILRLLSQNHCSLDALCVYKLTQCPQYFANNCNPVSFYDSYLTIGVDFTFKVHIFWEGHKILRNIHLTFVLCSASQK